MYRWMSARICCSDGFSPHARGCTGRATMVAPEPHSSPPRMGCTGVFAGLSRLSPIARGCTVGAAAGHAARKCSPHARGCTDTMILGPVLCQGSTPRTGMHRSSRVNRSWRLSIIPTHGDASMGYGPSTPSLQLSPTHGDAPAARKSRSLAARFSTTHGDAPHCWPHGAQGVVTLPHTRGCTKRERFPILRGLSPHAWECTASTAWNWLLVLHHARGCTARRDEPHFGLEGSSPRTGMHPQGRAVTWEVDGSPPRTGMRPACINTPGSLPRTGCAVPEDE